MVRDFLIWLMLYDITNTYQNTTESGDTIERTAVLKNRNRPTEDKTK